MTIPCFARGCGRRWRATSASSSWGKRATARPHSKLIAATKPDIAVLDVNLPGLSGLEVARRLQAARHPTRLIVLTMYKEEETCNLALDLGVKGYVLKENAVQEILTSMSVVAWGNTT